MKKVFAVTLLSVFLCYFFLACTPQDEKINFYIISNEDGTCMVTGVKNFKGDILKIPDKLKNPNNLKEDLLVTEINTDLFFYRIEYDITELFLPVGLVEFGRSDSYPIINYNISIETVHFNEKINANSFAYIELQNFTVHKKNENFYIENGCLIEKETKKLILGLNNIEIPSDVSEIGDYAFAGQKGLVLEELPQGLKKIGVGAFYGCEKITEIILPDGITEIKSYTFENTGLVNISIPGSVTEIGYSAFANTKLNSIPEMKNVTTLNDKLFFGCENFVDITVPEGIEVIQCAVFGNCFNLEKISFPSTLKYIYDLAFSSYPIPDTDNFNTTALKEVSVSAENPYYYAVSNNLIEKETKKVVIGLELANLPNDVEIIGDNAYVYENKLIEIYKFSENVVTIERYAFYNLNFNEIYIPASVECIKFGAFYEKINENAVIYCEAKSKPDGWNDYWNCAGYTVVWGYKNQ